MEWSAGQFLGAYVLLAIKLDQYIIIIIYCLAYTNQSHIHNGDLNQVHCGFDNPPGPGEVCAVDLSNLGECAPNTGYGFERSAPCFYMKLNRVGFMAMFEILAIFIIYCLQIFNWVPEFYDDVDDLPENMPGDLKEYIKSLPVKEVGYLNLPKKK